MANFSKPIRGRAYKFYIGLVSRADTKLLQNPPTLQAADFNISKDGGTFTALTTTPSTNPSGSRAVMIDLSATEMDANNIVLQCVDNAGAEWCDQLISIEPREQKIDYAHFVMRDTSGNPATGKTVSVQVLRDDGTFAAIAGSVVEESYGLYRAPLTLTEMNAQDSATLYCTATGCMPQFITYTSVY